jgi:electron transfer flavoprotein beta subunit
MKILVCITKTPDTTTKVQFTDNNTKFVEEGVQWIINPYDEWYALVRALELKESGAATEVHLISVGGADVEPIMRKALALGGEQAIRVNAENTDTFNTAAQIANYAKENSYDLVLAGKESIDYNNGSVPAMVAEHLGAQFVPNATKLDVDGGSLNLEREIDGGKETLTVSTPAVISCQKGMAEARIPNMRGIMAARTKPLNVVEPAAAENLTETVSYELPPAKSGVKLIDAENVQELVDLLHNEAKVI